MKRSYHGYEIDAHRDKSMTGESMVFFSVFREGDGLEVTSGFSYGTVRDEFTACKARVDRILNGTEPLDDDDAEAA